MNTAQEMSSFQGVRYFVTQAGTLGEMAQKLRHDVYLDLGYIENAYPDRIIPDNHKEDEYVVAYCDDNVLGTLKFSPIVCANELLTLWDGQLKECALEHISKFESGKSVVVGALAVGKGNNDKKVSWGIYKTSLLYSLNNHIKHWLIAIDARALRVMDMVGWRIHRIGNPMFYMGSSTVLCVLNMDEQMASFEKKQNAFYEMLIS